MKNYDLLTSNWKKKIFKKLLGRNKNKMFYVKVSKRVNIHACVYVYK